MRHYARFGYAFACLLAALCTQTPGVSAAPTSSRIAGGDRYGTAAAISAATFNPDVSLVVIATGENFPDALAGGPVAAKAKGPVLLVNATELPKATADELTRLDPGNIVVLGGTNVISEAVKNQLQSYTPGQVTRVAGGDRFETAAALSAATFAANVPVTYVANGSGFADALAGGPAAGKLGGPVLLVAQDSIPSATATELSRLTPTAIVVLGGSSAVSSAVEEQLHNYSSSVGRLAGADRYETAVAVSANTFSPGVPKVFLATGVNFPDALAGGPPGALAPGPLLLVQPNCIPGKVNAEIDRLAPAQLVILGGTSVVGAAVENRTECPLSFSDLSAQAQQYVLDYNARPNAGITRWVKVPILVWASSDFSQADLQQAINLWTTAIGETGLQMAITADESAADITFSFGDLSGAPPGVCGYEGPTKVDNHVITAGSGRYRSDPQCSGQGNAAATGLAHGLGHILGFGGHTPDNTDIMSTPNVPFSMSVDLQQAMAYIYSSAPGSVPG